MIETKDAQELVQIVNENDEEVGSAVRQYVRNENLIHRVTYIFLLNSEEKFWVHKRTQTKAWCPGHYDMAFGGIVDFKESYFNSALRELEEEAGVKSEIKEQFKMFYKSDNNINWGMIYTARSDGPLVLQESEVESVELLSKDDIQNKLKDSNNKFAPDSLQAYQQLVEKLNKGEITL